MPNGGSDCCGTCWFNKKNRGQAGYNHMDSNEKDYCIIRDLEIEFPFYTYCANHPHHNPNKIDKPVGSVYTGDSSGFRWIWRKSPDTEEIRLTLLTLLKTLPEEPNPEYPTATQFDEEIIRQLQEFNEPRAIPGLKRVLQFKPYAMTQDIKDETTQKTYAPSFRKTRIETIACAIEALAAIEKDRCLFNIIPFLIIGIIRKKKSSDNPKDDIYSIIRYSTVKALDYCESPQAFALLQVALQDPDKDIVSYVKEIIKKKE
jgi:hypothetical protein